MILYAIIITENILLNIYKLTQEARFDWKHTLYIYKGGHDGRVVTLSPLTFEIRVRFPALPQVGKLVVACCWSAVNSTEP